MDLTDSGNGRHTFFNNGYMYEVDPEYTGVPRVFRFDANGDIWAEGDCANASPTLAPHLDNYVGVNTGGLWVARFNSAGIRQFIAPA